jgi:hypothetical protein
MFWGVIGESSFYHADKVYESIKEVNLDSSLSQSSLKLFNLDYNDRKIKSSSERSNTGDFSRKLRDTEIQVLPAGLKNQSKEESNYLKLHKCRDAGEVYGASYLITREHLIYQFTGDI